MSLNNIKFVDNNLRAKGDITIPYCTLREFNPQVGEKFNKIDYSEFQPGYYEVEYLWEVIEVVERGCVVYDHRKTHKHLLEWHRWVAPRINTK